MSALIFAIIFLLLIAHYYYRYYRIVKHYGKVRGPFPLPFLGNVLGFSPVENILPYFLKLMKEYGTVYRCLNGYMPYIIVTDHDLCNKLMNSSAMNTKDYVYTFFHNWLGSGLLTSTGNKWSTHRKLITPSFHFNILKSFVQTYETVADILIKKLKGVEEEKSFDVYPYITLYTMDIICETSLGTKINAQTDSNSEYVRAVRSVLNFIVQRMMNPLKQLKILYMFFPSYWQEQKLTNIIKNHTNSIIAKRKKLHAEGKINMDLVTNYGSKKKIAFIDMLICGTIQGVPLTDEEIREEVDTFMFEGHDTSSSALASILYLLSINSEAQNKLYTELVSIFGTDKDKHATFEELQDMPYLEMVIKEGMRLYPPVPAFSRYVSEDLDFGTLQIKANTGVFMSPYIAHRVPEYFPEPEKFIPERFSAENVHKIKPFSYIPFSGGYRNCIGQKFAMLEMKSAISRIIRNFEVLPDPDFEPIIVAEIITKSMNGIRIKLRRRK